LKATINNVPLSEKIYSFLAL